MEVEEGQRRAEQTATLAIAMAFRQRLLLLAPFLPTGPQNLVICTLDPAAAIAAVSKPQTTQRDGKAMKYTVFSFPCQLLSCLCISTGKRLKPRNISTFTLHLLKFIPKDIWRGSIYQEVLMIINIYIPTIEASEYLKHILLDLTG